jgi:nitroreductase
MEISMELFEAISKRRSYRAGFSDAAVAAEDLKKIVAAALSAPSGCNAQTTEFVIINDEATVASIAKMHPTNAAMMQGKAFIACILDREAGAVYDGMSFQVEDCAAAVENMLLAITALGYETVWIDGWLRREGRAEAIGSMINVPESKIIRILLPIGVASEEYSQPGKKPFQERAWFNKYKS